MGVADIMRLWGDSDPRCLSAERCNTPKRCCSSVTANASLGRETPDWIKAWVPINKSSVPSAAIWVSSRFQD